MIKRIDLFMPTSSQYGALHHFTQRLYEALMRYGVNCKLLVAEKKNPRPFLTQLFNDPPDCTLSFNGVLPDDEGRFLCDLIKIPHVACIVDSPVHFFPLIRSPFNIITCIDLFSCDFFRGMKYNNVLFMPLAIEKNIVIHPDEERNYDVLLLASYIDHVKIADTWEKTYPPSVYKALLSAAEMTLSNQTTPYIQVLVKSLEQQASNDKDNSFQHLDIVELLDSFESYIRGLERVRLVKSIKNARIDIFGSGHTKAIWDSHLGKDHNVVIHEGVPYEQALELMKHSKIVLNSCAWIKNGAHDRTFAGMACGAAVLTSDNPYIASNFVENESILLYRGNAMDQVDSTVSEILQDEHKRQSIAAKGKEITMHHHTWDQRAAVLVKEIDPIVKEIKAAQN